jgi:hypothetical protein
MPEQILIKFSMYMAPEPISTACLCLSLLSLLGKGSVKCIPPLIARQRLGKHVPAAIHAKLEE